MSEHGSQHTTDILLAHEVWVRALARRLVEGESQADDLVQEAWLVAQRRGPVSIRRPRSWLAGILKNLARQSWRGEARRRRQEELAAASPPEATLERAELGRELAGIVLALDEPFRTALLLRFYENLPPRVIAQRTGVAVATADARIARGLAKVRERWKRQHGEDTWLRGLWLISTSRALPRAVPTGSAATGATAGLSTVASLGGIAVNAKLVLAAALVAAGGLFWVLPRGEAPRLRTAEREGASASPITTPAGSPAPSAAVALAESPPGERPRSAATLDSARSGADLIVRVVDARSGKALEGVPLHLRSLDARAAPGEVATSARTDAKGIATLRNARRFLLGQADSWSVVHDIPFERPPSLLLTPRWLAEDVVVSEQPASGSLAVVLAEAAGQPLTGTSTTLLLLPADGAKPPMPAHGQSWKGALQNGSTLFRYVELGREWEAQVRLDHSDLAARAQGAGPGLPDAVARLEVSSEVTGVTLRAVDRRGVPLAESVLGVTRFTFFGSEHELEVRTDAQGRFLVGDPEALTSVHVRTIDPPGSELAGDAALGPFERPAEGDVRDIVLQPDALLASGRVVDEAGHPVDGAVVLAGKAAHFPCGAEWRIDGFALGGSPEASTISGPDGRFALQGNLPTSTFTILAYDRSWRCEPSEAELGQTGLELVLAPVWTVRGAVLVDEGVPPEALGIALAGPGDKQRSAKLNGEKRFALDAVPRGTYALICSSGEAELARKECAVLDGDLDAGAFDLRGRLFRHAIVLLGDEPEVPRWEVEWRPCASDEPRSKVAIQGRRAEIWAPAPCIDARVTSPGMRTETLPGISGRAEVRLRSGLPVRIVLQTELELPPPPYVLIPSLVLDGAPVGEPLGLPDFTDQRREVVFLLPAPGNVELTWGLLRRAGSLTVGGGLGAEGVRLRVADQDAEQTFFVGLDAGALARALRAETAR